MTQEMGLLFLLSVNRFAPLFFSQAIFYFTRLSWPGGTVPSPHDTTRLHVELTMLSFIFNLYKKSATRLESLEFECGKTTTPAIPTLALF